ncbi:MotA/TolQ/ExbB proton channel family protein [Thermohalobacter berrensis]|uniref:MotA/TolQ/ExbB proton channel domain-containing protein n=1 Tax=Thermohalobacter berrensis TaxID=99594 RepID=A0A419T826_9FIRM|nr:MotA/TolQ/ExbB proton channel family protein [Thermohalobacter berrensis]RKD33516.1 hypothetical protein BET03_09010 [Thermohalobacter berrensis]
MISLIGKLNPLALTIISVIVVIFISSFVTTIIIRKRYKNISSDLKEGGKDKEGKYNHNILNMIIKDYKGSARENPNEVNTQAIIEKHFNTELRSLQLGERFVKNSVSLMIILGLLGTFYGLTLSIGELVQLLTESGSTEVVNSINSIVGGLIDSVQGMSVAFITSLFGIAAAIVTTIINIIFNIEDEKEALMVEIEEYLDNDIALFYTQNKEKEYSLLNEVLTSNFNMFLDKLDDNLNEIMDTTGKRLLTSSQEAEKSTKALQASIEKFDEALKDFRENTRDFSEFNYNLRTNIQRMNVSFADLTEDLRDFSSVILKEQEAKKELASAIEKLSQK